GLDARLGGSGILQIGTVRLDAHGQAHDIDAPIFPEPVNDARIVVLRPPVVPTEGLPAQHGKLAPGIEQLRPLHAELPMARHGYAPLAEGRNVRLRVQLLPLAARRRVRCWSRAAFRGAPHRLPETTTDDKRAGYRASQQNCEPRWQIT